MALGVLVVDYLVLGSISGAVRCLSGAQVAGSGPVAVDLGVFLLVLKKWQKKHPGLLKQTPRWPLFFQLPPILYIFPTVHTTPL